MFNLPNMAEMTKQIEDFKGQFERLVSAVEQCQRGIETINANQLIADKKQDAILSALYPQYKKAEQTPAVEQEV